MRRRRPGIFASLCCAILLLPGGMDARAGCDDDIIARQRELSNAGWEIVRDGDDIKVYNREHSGSPIREVLALATFEQRACRLYAAISDYDRYPHFMPDVKTSRVLRRDGNSTWVFQELEFPWPISNRYYTIRLTADTTRGDHGRYFVSWTLSQAVPETPEGKGIQLETDDGHWRFCALKGGRTLVEYYAHVDPGGLLPSWAVNAANTRVVPDVLEALKRRAGSDAYQGC